MKTLVLSTLAGLFLALAGCAVALTLHLDRSLTALDASLEESHTILQHADMVLFRLNGVADNEQKYYDQGARQMAGSMKAARLLIDRLDRGLTDANWGTIPLLNKTVTLLASDGDQMLAHVDTQFSQTAAAAQVSLESVTSVADSLRTRINDPHLTATVVHLDEASLHFEDAALSLAQTSASGAHVARFYEDKLTKPESLAKTVFWGALKIFGETGGGIAGFFHK